MLSVAPGYEQLTLRDLHWMLFPAVGAGQVRLFNHDGRTVGVALWAFISDAVEARLREDVAAGRATRLAQDDWTRGQRAWLVEVAAVDPSYVAGMVVELSRTVFNGRDFRFCARDNDTGNRTVQEATGPLAV